LTANPASRQLHEHAAISRDATPQRTLIIRTPKRTHGFRYSGLLDWEGTDTKLILHFTRANVIIHGKDLLKTYISKLADDRLPELVEPLRGDKFGAGITGSVGVEKIDVEIVER
jgi:hypothetical protein